MESNGSLHYAASQKYLSAETLDAIGRSTKNIDPHNILVTCFHPYIEPYVFMWIAYGLATTGAEPA